VYTGWNLSGAYAEYVLCDQTHVHPLPDKVSFEQGAAMHVPYTTAYRALFQKAQARRGEWVLVHGATGGVGLAAVQLARAAGLQVIGTGGTDKGRDMLRDQGCQLVLDHTKPDYLQEVMAVTEGLGAGVILEMLANVNLDRDLDVLSKGGRVVVIGSRGRVEIEPRKLMSRDAAVLGLVLFNTPPDDMAQIHKALVAGLEDGTLRPVVNKVLPLAEAPRAHADVMAPGAFGKIVLSP